MKREKSALFIDILNMYVRCLFPGNIAVLVHEPRSQYSILKEVLHSMKHFKTVKGRLEKPFLQ